MKPRQWLFFFVLIANIGYVHAQQIQIINSNEIRYDAATRSKYCKGNIKVLHEGVYIECDSAVINDNDRTMLGLGNVYIYQPDSFDLRGEKVFYNGINKMARVSGNVVMTDNDMVLTTPFIDYDTENKHGSYTQNGKIVANQDVLTSQKGYYDSRTQMAFFKDSVVLVNPEYTMYSDTLKYHSPTSVAYFLGPTQIVSDDNRIECTRGYYNTNTNIASFWNRASLYSDASVLTADSFFYNRNTGVGKAFERIVLIDTSEQIHVYGNQGIYYELKKESVVFQNPVAEKFMDSDTLLVLADTLFVFSDSLNKKLLAYNHAQIFSSDMSGVCDTLLYRMQDSIIEMKKEPFLWNENKQISGDSITLFLVQNKVDRMEVRNKSFIASHHEMEWFDQISGKNIDHYFIDNKLRRVEVMEKAKSLYYMREDDTGAYVGVNKIEGGYMTVLLDSVGIDQIKFYPIPSPEGKLYPPLELPAEDIKFSEFVWRPELKPLRQTFETRKAWGRKPEE